ncbi:MAG: mevalonate kinase [Candidatus Thermoplasmatota archaeon]|nr:mevalonate kinase [Candidatus Thermoplasmatota archaeon]
MLEASSPAKAILFGEHAVVYGKPAIAISLDRRMNLTVFPAGEATVDGGRLSMRKHRYVKKAYGELWEGPAIAFRTRSSIPSASGLGSSAALSCSAVAAMLFLRGDLSEENIARKAFEVEYAVQGRASPTDTSCSTHGNAIMVSPLAGDDLLWTILAGENVWNVHHVDPPELKLVVGYTKKPSITPIQVEKVRNYYNRSGFARETIDDIGSLALDGMKALRSRDLVEIGELMDRNHSLLTILGVTSRELDKLRDAAGPLSYGTKLTGAGGGGSIIALTERPDEVCEAIRVRGGVPFSVSTTRKGTSVEVTDRNALDIFIKPGPGKKD